LEVKAAAKLSHRNIVTAHDAEQAGDLHFLVMEFVEGESLAETVKRRGPLPVLHACNYIVQSAQGLQHAFETGMVHRDIKPQNLMRTSAGTIKILDFGLARLATESDEAEDVRLTKVGVTLGTTDYIAPEQIEDSRSVDIRADLYSLGCTFYYLLTGQVPFPGRSPVDKLKAHLQEEPQPLGDLRDDLPAEVVHAIERMMAKDPAKRFQTPQEVIEALSPFARKSNTKPPVHRPVKPPALPIARPTEIEETREMEGVIGQVAVSQGHENLHDATSQELDLLNLPIEELVAPGIAKSIEASRPRAQKKPRNRWASLAIFSVAATLLLLASFAGYRHVWNSEPPTVAQQQEDPASEPAGDIGLESLDTDTSGSQDGEPKRLASAAASPNRDPTALYVLPQQRLFWDDFEPPRSALERAGIRVVVASSAMDDIRVGSNVVQVDVLLSNARPADYDMLLFGGAPNPDQDLEFMAGEHLQTATAFIGEMLRQGKYVATVCNGTAILAESGCLDGLRAARSGPMLNVERRHREINWVDDRIVLENGILTAGSNDVARRLFNERIVSLLTTGQ
jgi:serine/threonine-protein kinase